MLSLIVAAFICAAILIYLARTTSVRNTNLKKIIAVILKAAVLIAPLFVGRAWVYYVQSAAPMVTVHWTDNRPPLNVRVAMVAAVVAS